MHASNQPVVGGRPSPHQLVMREVNLKIVETATSYERSRDDLYCFVCECSDPECSQAINLRLHQFDPTLPAGSVLAKVPDTEQESSI